MADETMHALIAVFDEADEAATWLTHAHDAGYDPAEGIVITRDEDSGKVHKHLANLPGVAAGAGVGAVVGVILGALFPPVIIGEALAAAIGLGAAGAVVGAGGVAAKDEIVDRSAFKDVGEELKPGQSALILVMDEASTSRFQTELQGYISVWVQKAPTA